MWDGYSERRGWWRGGGGSGRGETVTFCLMDLA